MSTGLTPRMAQCLAVIRDLTVDGVPPSYTQIQIALGLASKSGVHSLLSQLRERGKLDWDHARPRSIRLVEDDWARLDRLSDTDLRTLRVRIDVLLDERTAAVVLAP